MSHPTTPISARLADRLRRQARVLVREARRADACKVEGIHQARVASRRLREMLAIASAAADGNARSLARDAKRIGRVLGPLREIDVSSEVWREPHFEVPWPPTLLTRLDRVAELERARLVPQMRSTLQRLAGAGLRERTDSLASSLQSAPAERAIEAALVRSVRTRSRSLERVLDEAGTVYAPEPLHQVRIAAKQFRYALELARDLSKLGLTGPLRRLKTQQDLLGRLHDLQVVQDRLQVLATERGVSRAMLRAIKAAGTDLEAECRSLHARFVAGVPALRELVASTRAMVELEHVQLRSTRMAAERPDVPARRAGTVGGNRP